MAKIFRRILYPKGSTALKWKEISILFLALMCSAMSISILFPFLPAMVKEIDLTQPVIRHQFSQHFGKTEEETGYYAGLIASSMFTGRFISSYFWGYLADKYGRRPVVIISLFLLSVNLFAFGLSSTVTMAILTRLGVGLSNGFLGTAKAIISEICDHTNQSLGMSTLTSAYTTGLIFGPAMGGFLSEVGKKYPRVFPKGSFFEQFPFMLPCLINSVLLVLSMIMLYIWLPETLVKRSDSSKKKDRSEKKNGFLFSALLKKSEGDPVVKLSDETSKKSQNCELGNATNNTKIKELIDTDETPEAKAPDQAPDENITYRESTLMTNKKANETFDKIHDGNDGTSINDYTDKLLSEADRTPGSLSETNNTDDICSSANSENSKESEGGASSAGSANCTGNDCIKCSTNKIDKGTYSLRESDCCERDEKSSKESDEHKALINKDQMNVSIGGIESLSTKKRFSTSNERGTTAKETPNLPRQKPTGIEQQTSNSTQCVCKTDSKRHSTESTVSAPKRTCCSYFGSIKESKFWRILRNVNAVLSVFVYSIFSLSVIGSDELFNIWGATEPRLGGLGFTTDDLGTAILVVGIALTLIQLTVLPKVERKLGTVLNFQICVMFCILFIVTQPCLRVLRGRPNILWPVVLIHLTLLRLSFSGAFLSTFLLINNSVKQDLLCSVNGLAISVSSFIKSFGPSIGGSLFAWSISSGYKLGFPFNINLAFIFFGFSFLLSIFLSCFLSETLNKPKISNEKEFVRQSMNNLFEAKA